MPITCTVKPICEKKIEEVDAVEVISMVLVVDNMLEMMSGEWPFVLSLDVCFPCVLVPILLCGHVLQFNITSLIQGNT